MDNDNTCAKLSVRSLVEFVYRYGDLNSEYVSSSSAIEGTKIHKNIQKEYENEHKEKEEEFLKEVPIKDTFSYKSLNIFLEGRIDGVISKDNYAEILEIKSTSRDILSIEIYNELHIAQAKIYGYMYCKLYNLDKVTIKIIYVNRDTFLSKDFSEIFSFDDLKDFFFCTIDKYFKFLTLDYNFKNLRNNSIKILKFPFEKYRPNQRELSVTVYQTIKHNKKLFLEAPTGIGKTISTVFPSLKALEQKLGNRIFYLTAKSSTKIIAENTINLLRNQGLKLKTLTLTAKEKICFKENVNCDPTICEFAKGHFDRANNAILDIIENEDNINKEIINSYSMKHKVCPFEISLDLISYCDFIICDYNYVFDMQVSLKTYFNEKKNENILLIDEAHNLVDRARDMYSSSLSKSEFLNLKKLIKNDDFSLYKKLDKVNKVMIEIRKYNEENNFYIFDSIPTELIKSLHIVFDAMSTYLSKDNINFKDNVLDLYFKINDFLKKNDIFDENYICYSEKTSSELTINIFCINPSSALKISFKNAVSTILFSATLSPMPYYKELLAFDDGDYNLTLTSPFDIKNREVIIANNVSTKYTKREANYKKVCNYIHTTFNITKGNYMVFFPSYKYMKDIHKLMTEEFNYNNIIMQDTFMTEDERLNFIDKFNTTQNIIGFCVLGGVFSEGIDLKGDSLIGSIIVGVGLPKLSLKQNLIKDHFDSKNGDGFHYAYTFPGINKVIQAAGRVIRSDDDKGIIFLIDERFSSSLYQQLLPKHFFPQTIINTSLKSENIIKQFFNI